VEVQCSPDRLAEQLRARIAHLMTGPIQEDPPVLRVTLEELQPSWIEVRDSRGRWERGSFERVAFYVRKWVTGAFVAAHPDLLWLHAAAAALEDRGLLLAGPAGAGKSTLLVRLLGCGWSLLADDAVGLVPERHQALPLAFNPEVRTAPRYLECDWQAFLEQPKVLAEVPANGVASTPAAIGAIVFPEYSADIDEPELAPLTVVQAAHTLATQCLYPDDNKLATLDQLFRLAGKVPCCRFRYRDSLGAAVRLTERWFSGLGRA
jgi:hypothetical protein